MPAVPAVPRVLWHGRNRGEDAVHCPTPNEETHSVQAGRATCPDAGQETRPDAGQETCSETREEADQETREEADQETR